MEMAFKHDWPKAAAAVIERGCGVNAQDRIGWSALHFAGFHNRQETARVLLERGADRTIKNVNGESAADLARECGHGSLAASIDGFDSEARLFNEAASGETEASFLEVLRGSARTQKRRAHGADGDGHVPRLAQRRVHRRSRDVTHQRLRLSALHCWRRPSPQDAHPAERAPTTA